MEINKDFEIQFHNILIKKIKNLKILIASKCSFCESLNGCLERESWAARYLGIVTIILFFLLLPKLPAFFAIVVDLSFVSTEIVPHCDIKFFDCWLSPRINLKSIPNLHSTICQHIFPQMLKDFPWKLYSCAPYFKRIYI